MSRAIKFRAWDKEAKRMRYGKPEQFDDMLGFRFDHFETDEPVYMQYTGLKDLNGSDIYEGDIIQFAEFDYNGSDTQHIGVVKFECCMYQIWRTWDDEFWGSDGAFDFYGIHQQDDELEVIGNIYEHPNLLGEEQ